MATSSGSVLIDIKTATITSKGQVAIPKEIRSLKGYKEGEKIAIIAYRDRIELRPMKNLSIHMATALASEKALAKDWLSPEDERAWKDL